MSHQALTSEQRDELREQLDLLRNKIVESHHQRSLYLQAQWDERQRQGDIEDLGMPFAAVLNPAIVGLVMTPLIFLFTIFITLRHPETFKRTTAYGRNTHW
eukprot:CAMPEP_0206187600 /NCGR_PEP_ID=MMETSP0166-20121206/3095_1 /ASSEMBLY_ACC=CAM_ASM_000260 /TAXON_ID=95228 /ORGANISM="Vannella robusta, Strain DIVA3 518/3/11/1/6" /LENGTH=100 /DNA_ID=CAMNT_0053603207 /DNA_START=41 /DNA_END=340 /DNA_ORIENTATION=+